MALWPKSKMGWIRAGVVVVLAVLAYFLLIPTVGYLQYKPQEGDIVFQSLPPVNELVKIIEGVTESHYSHCGVVAREDGRWLVLESIGEVRKTPLFPWILRGRHGRFAVYRLKAEDREHIGKFIDEIRPFMGRPYDFKYRMDDEALYCSELIWKAWKNATGEHLGEPVRLGDLKWEPYEEGIRKLEGGPPPLDVKIITPVDLSQAKQLEKVFGGGF